MLRALRPGRARHDAARAQRSRGAGRAARGQARLAGDHPHGPGRGRGPGRRARRRRDRLPDQAVLAGASSRPGSAPSCACVAQTPTTTLIGGDVEVDLITREVRRGGAPVRLSTTEFELLSYLLRNSGRVLSREQILRAVWGYEYDPGTNVVDVYVGYLRRKLRQAGRQGPDRHRAGRSATGSMRRPSGSSMSRARQAPADRRCIPEWPALAADGLGRGADAGLRRGHLLRRLPRHRHRAAQPDRPRHRAATPTQLAQAVGAHAGQSAEQVAAGAREYVEAQPYNATSTLLFVLVPGARAAFNHPEIVGPARARRRETLAPAGGRERAGAAACWCPTSATRCSTVPDVGPMRVLERPVRVGSVPRRRRGRRAAGDRRSRPARRRADVRARGRADAGAGR